MDTMSHIAMGTGIAIMANSSQTINHEYELITYGVIIGASVLPDIDIISKINGNKTYINQHRGFTHSIIFLFLLTIIANAICNIFLPNNIYLGWIFFSILLHITTDIFNNYGVKLLWPFVDKWISFNATYTIDLFILVAHAIGFILYFIFGMNGLMVFSIVIVSCVTYLFVLLARKEFRVKFIKDTLTNIKKVTLISKPIAHQWKFVAYSYDGYYYIGDLRGNKLTVLHSEKKVRRIDQDLYNHIKHDKNFKIFIKFAKVYNWDIVDKENEIEIRLRDLTYYVKINKEYNYLFNCLITIDKSTNKIKKSYVGFTSNDDALYKMVDHNNFIKKFLKREKIYE